MRIIRYISTVISMTRPRVRENPAAQAHMQDSYRRQQMTFIISRMLGGGGTLLIGDLIEMQFLGNSYNINFGAAISLVLMVIVLLIMTILNQFGADDDGVMVI